MPRPSAWSSNLTTWQPKSCPRPTLRRVLKAHLDTATSSASPTTSSAGKKASLSKDCDVLAYLAYLSFLQKLARNARIEAIDATAGAKRRMLVGAREVRRAAKVHTSTGSRAGPDLRVASPPRELRLA